MKNYVTEAEFLPTLKSSRTLTVTTDYNRVDTETPFVNRIVLNKLHRDCDIEIEDAPGPYHYKVTLVE